jgi:hypothetical protein
LGNGGNEQVHQYLKWAEKMAETGLMLSATGLPEGRRTGQGVKHFIEPEGRFSQAFSEMPQACLWPFSPAALEGKKKERYTEKVTYRCPGCGAKVWGKGGAGTHLRMRQGVCL